MIKKNIRVEEGGCKGIHAQKKGREWGFVNHSENAVQDRVLSIITPKAPFIKPLSPYIFVPHTWFIMLGLALRSTVADQGGEGDGETLLPELFCLRSTFSRVTYSVLRDL